jgi:phosphoribosylanthranilate isomerase
MGTDAEEVLHDLKYLPQIKICGLTVIEDAIECAELGADAVGLVFYKKSHRYITDVLAREICASLPEKIKKVGVFVDAPFETIMHKVERCRLNAVQLHGNEPPGLTGRLMNEGLVVVKALFLERKPSFEDTANYNVTAFLAECGKGSLPGGNALSWDWEKAKKIGVKHPYILAGGLSPENVCNAVSLCLPDAVDVSSGVESAPGVKNIQKIKLFISNVKSCLLLKKTGRIF